MLVFIAIAVGLMSAWLLYHALLPLTETASVTASEWERIEDESIRLLERRDLLIAELKDLEFEAALNKVGDRDLEQLRARYEAEALDVVRQLDAQAEAYTDRIDEDIADRIAAAKARKAAQEPVIPPAEPPKPLEAPPPPDPNHDPTAGLPVSDPMLHSCPACGHGMYMPGKFCDACGAAMTHCSDCDCLNRGDAKFCRACGTGLEAEK